MRTDGCGGPRNVCHDDNDRQARTDRDCGKIRGAPEHLESVRFNGETYDLTTEKGRKKLDEAVEKYEKKHGVELDYDRRTNQLVVGDEKAVYDLDKKGDFKDFNADRKDGAFDGQVTASHLRGNVSINGFEFDMRTEKGREAFAKDLADGTIDGIDGAPVANVGYDAESNRVVVVGPNGKAAYDLDNFDDFVAFRADADGGAIDGMFGAPAPSAPASPPAPAPPSPPPATPGGAGGPGRPGVDGLIFATDVPGGGPATFNPTVVRPIDRRPLGAPAAGAPPPGPQASPPPGGDNGTTPGSTTTGNGPSEGTGTTTRPGTNGDPYANAPNPDGPSKRPPPTFRR